MLVDRGLSFRPCVNPGFSPRRADRALLRCALTGEPGPERSAPSAWTCSQGAAPTRQRGHQGSPISPNHCHQPSVPCPLWAQV